MSNSFVFYESFHQAIRLLPERERLQAYEAVCNYALFGEEPEEMLPGTEVAFILIKPQIDANNQRRSNGGLGGRPRKEKPLEDNEKTDGYKKKKPMVSETKNHRLSETKTNGGQTQKPNVNVNVNVNDNVNVNANIYTPEFEEIWSHYPRKKEKAAAYKAYKARLHEYSEEQLLTATKRYAEECRIMNTEERYIKHGATFFGPSLPFADYLAEDWKPPEDSRKQRANGFHNFDQRDYDFDALQKAWGG